MPTDISFLKEKRRSLIGLSCVQKKQIHAEYMRNWRKKHPGYTEKQKIAFQNFLEKNPDYQYEYNIAWRKMHPDKILQISRNYKRRHLAKIAEQRVKDAKRYPDRKEARRKALKIKCSYCSFCGSSEQLERHHPDYSKPLEIIPLCHNCHVKLHRERNLAIEQPQMVEA